jgi:hypothetical protein
MSTITAALNYTRFECSRGLPMRIGQGLVAIALTVVILGQAGCASTGTANAQLQRGEATGTRVPANYRQLVANRILETTDSTKIRRATISQPQAKFVGLLHGGERPAVCAVVFRETPLFAEGRDCWVVTFSDGRVASAGYSYAGCDCPGSSAFEELLKR